MSSRLGSSLALVKFLNPEKILVFALKIRAGHCCEPAKLPFHLKSRTADLSWLSLRPWDQFSPILWAQEGA